jgi:hypothetical protein
LGCNAQSVGKSAFTFNPLQDEGTARLQNAGKYQLNDTAQHPEDMNK